MTLQESIANMVTAVTGATTVDNDTVVLLNEIGVILETIKTSPAQIQALADQLTTSGGPNSTVAQLVAAMKANLNPPLPPPVV